MTQRPIVTLIVERVEVPVGFRTKGPNNRLIIVEAIGEDEGLEIYYSGSEIAFPPEGMDGKWKPVPVPCECLRERG